MMCLRSLGSAQPSRHWFVVCGCPIHWQRSPPPQNWGLCQSMTNQPWFAFNPHMSFPPKKYENRSGGTQDSGWGHVRRKSHWCVTQAVAAAGAGAAFDRSGGREQLEAAVGGSCWSGMGLTAELPSSCGMGGAWSPQAVAPPPAAEPDRSN